MSHSRQRKKISKAAKPGTNRPPTDSEPPSEMQKSFKKCLDDLAIIGGFSNHVSRLAAGSPASQWEEMASMVHAKMCAHTRSIGAIALSSMFDHSAMMSITRVMIEAMTMFFYLLEKTEDQHEENLKAQMINLHDMVNRIMLIRASEDRSSDYDKLKVARDTLKSVIMINPYFFNLPKLQQDKILTGEQVFLGGMRKVAIRTCGWRDDTFKAFYSYFSAHTHSTPVSYIRTRPHKIDYYKPSDMQFAVAGLAIAVSIACMRRVTLAYVDRSPETISKLHSGLLKKFREEDRDSKVFHSGASSLKDD